MPLYLTRIKKPTVYHFWDNQKKDTLCKLYSTGGLIQNNYHLEYNINHLRVCNTCNSLSK